MVDYLGSITGSVKNGGWSLSGEAWNDADSIEFYAQLKSWFYFYSSGGWDAIPRGAFSGHVLPDPWSRNVQNSVAPFTAFTAQEFMKRGEVQGIYFASNPSPANRHQIIDMNYGKIIYELIGGHCNLMHPNEDYDSLLWGGAFQTVKHPEGFVQLNIDFTNSSLADVYEIKDGQFWATLKTIANLDFYELYVDKNSILNYIPHPMFSGALPAPVLDIDNGLLLEPLTIERRFEEIGQVVLHGTTPAGQQIKGKYPIDPTAGPTVRRSGYIAKDAAKMNTIAERMYKFENRDSTVTAKLGGGIGLMLDLMDRVTITYASADDGVNWIQKAFWIHKIDVGIGNDFNAMTTLELEAENS